MTKTKKEQFDELLEDATSAGSVQDKFATTRKELNEIMIERTQEIDMILTALICQEHVLLVGDPGTGKSMLADAVVDWLDGSKFSVLLNKFSTPEEVYGPISLTNLKADKYVRITTNMAPEANVVFFDEVFKASTAILNTALRLLNEREFDNGGTVTKCPLKLAVGASNEWPSSENGQGAELGALFDRFLFRREVKPIGSERGLDKLLWSGDISTTLTSHLTPEEIVEATDAAKRVTWSDDAREAFTTITRAAKAEGIVPGDRRLRKSISAVQAFTWLCGDSVVEKDHLEILQHILWTDPKEQPRTLAQVVAKVANPLGLVINELLCEAEEVIGGVDTKDLQSAAVGSKKLGEIVKKLKKQEKKGGKKVAEAIEYVEGRVADIKAATMENF